MGSIDPRTSRALSLAATIALAAACSSDDAQGADSTPCSPGAAACAAAGASGAAVAGGGGLGATGGSSGAAGAPPAAGSGGAGAVAGGGGASGASGSVGSAGASAGAGAEQDAAVMDAGESDAGADAARGDDASVTPPPYLPLYRVAVRIHAAESALSDEQFTAVTAEVNQIWRAQAGVCFEFELVDHEDLGPGLDIRYGPGTSSDPNGYYSGDNDIFSRDQPSLGAAPNPVQLPTARTTAHEFGHALGLQHQDFGDACPNGTGDLDCNDLLMRSGRRGYFLSEPEIERAREVAEGKAHDDTTPADCGALVIMR